MGFPMIYPQNRFKKFQNFFIYPSPLSSPSCSSLLYPKLRSTRSMPRPRPSAHGVGRRRDGRRQFTGVLILCTPFPAGCNIRPPLFVLSYTPAPGLAASLCFRRFPSFFVLCRLLPRFLRSLCKSSLFPIRSLSRPFTRFYPRSLPASFFILSPISPKYANSPFRLYSHLSGPLQRFSPCFAQACPFSFQPLFVSFFQGKPSINTKPPNDGAKDWRANPPCRASVARL